MINNLRKIIKKTLGENFFFNLFYFYKILTKNYLLKKPIGNSLIYKKLYKNFLKKIYNDNFINSNFTINEKKFINKLGYLTQVSIKKSAINFYHGYLLAYYIKNIVHNSSDKFSVLETGTAKGFSSIIMSKFISNLKINFQIYTIDLIPNNQKIYWNSVTDHICGKITREQLLSKYKKEQRYIKFLKGNSIKLLKKLNLERINFAFLDGSHKYDDVKFEFKYINKRNKSGDIIFFDDYTINQYDGIVKLISEIKASNTYSVSIHNPLENRGYAVLVKK